MDYFVCLGTSKVARFSTRKVAQSVCDDLNARTDWTEHDENGRKLCASVGLPFHPTRYSIASEQELDDEL